MRSLVTFAAACSLAAALAGCPKGGEAALDGPQPGTDGDSSAPAGVTPPSTDGPEGLGALFAQVVAANGAGDVAEVAAICRRIYPEPARIRQGLRDGAPEETVAKIEAFYAKLRPQAGDDAAWAKLLETPPERTEVKVYPATTEEIAAVAAGGVVAAEFNSEAPAIAKRLLRPGSTYYVVEATEPGADLGTKFHLFFWDGSEWCMLGPVWRAQR